MRRNDGAADSPFAAGNKMDDLFFFVRPDGDREVELYVVEVVLFDASDTLWHCEKCVHGRREGP